MKNLMFLAVLFMAVSCTDVNSSTKCLKQNNYKPLKVGGYAFFGGSRDDWYATKFIAIAPNGDTVSGVVTKGVFKGSTIRVND